MELYLEAHHIMGEKIMINQNYEGLLILKMDKMASLYLEHSNKKEFEELPFDERLAIMIDAQIADNKNKSIENLRRKATVKIANATIGDIIFLPERQIDKNLTYKLNECNYIKEKLNVIVTGATGAGKTFYTCALANAAINKEIRCKYIRMPDLLYDLSAFRESPKSFKRKLRNYGGYELLIIDDFLITELNETQQSDLFELLELRSENYSTILSSQFSSSSWYERLGSGAIADAIMDRIIHNSYIVDIKGSKSMREITSKTK